jgi:transposase
MFTENLFTKLLQFEQGWIVKSVETDLTEQEIYIEISCILDHLVDEETGEVCIYDRASVRSWRHLDTMQYKTFIKCQLPRNINSNGKIKTVQPNWASCYERYTYLFEHVVIELLQASKNQTKIAKLMRCGFNVINRILHQSVESDMKRRKLSPI